MHFQSFQAEGVTKTAIIRSTVDDSVCGQHLAFLSPKQHSMIGVVCICLIHTKRKPLTKAGSPNILVCVVATYNTFQAVLDFLCRHVL